MAGLSLLKSDSPRRIAVVGAVVVPETDSQAGALIEYLDDCTHRQQRRWILEVREHDLQASWNNSLDCSPGTGALVCRTRVAPLEQQVRLGAHHEERRAERRILMFWNRGERCVDITTLEFLPPNQGRESATSSI